MGLMIAVIIAVVVLGIPLTLLWWKIADAWADRENQRFGRTPPPEQTGPPPTVVEIPEPDRTHG